MVRFLFHSLLIAVCSAALAPAQGPQIGNCPVFPADHIWNTPIDTLPVAANSSTLINTIGSGIGLHPDFGSGTWDGEPIGIPFITVPGTQTKFPATFTYSDESDPGPYAIPMNAPIEGGSNSSGDRHAIAVDTDNCILYELYSAYPQGASWSAGSGAIFDLKGYTLRPATWTSADAAGLPIFPGLARYDEVAAGAIHHALRFTVPQTQKAYVWPARHYASSLTSTQYPPMGTRSRLKASFDVTSYPPEVQVILRALQKYGMIVADNGSAWYISGEPDDRWNNDNLHTIGKVLGSSFEVVDVSSLMIGLNSGQATQPGAPTPPSPTPPAPTPPTPTPVVVTPSSATVLTSAHRQFSANQTVTWAVNGVAGGNSRVGLLDSTGLYTAPASVPNPATVSVQATSPGTSGTMGAALVTITAPPPVVPPPPPTAGAAPAITLVTPNPSRTQSFTLVVTGAGFQSGAVVKLSGARLATTFVSTTQLTAKGSTTKTGGWPVQVTNPDGQISNSYFVTFAAARRR
ncbi:MAG TPA: hypothetical protein VLY24_04865 [Bryobacteraceae bacterium]|nr:hypothetical protein [Bryobacteraceae bacterium]